MAAAIKRGHRKDLDANHGVATLPSHRIDFGAAAVAAERRGLTALTATDRGGPSCVPREIVHGEIG